MTPRGCELDNMFDSPVGSLETYDSEHLGERYNRIELPYIYIPSATHDLK
jgi:hypothetical protein